MNYKDMLEGYKRDQDDKRLIYLQPSQHGAHDEVPFTFCQRRWAVFQKQGKEPHYFYIYTQYLWTYFWEITMVKTKKCIRKCYRPSMRKTVQVLLISDSTVLHLQSSDYENTSSGPMEASREENRGEGTTYQLKRKTSSWSFFQVIRIFNMPCNNSPSSMLPVFRQELKMARCPKPPKNFKIKIKKHDIAFIKRKIWVWERFQTSLRCTQGEGKNFNEHLQTNESVKHQGAEPAPTPRIK